MRLRSRVEPGLENEGVSWTWVDTVDGIDEIIVPVQKDLFSLGALLATPDLAKMRQQLEKAAIDDERIAELERAIDSGESELDPLRAFIIPGGTPKSVRLAASVGAADFASFDDLRSAIVDLSQTRVSGTRLIKVLTWFDNEWGYANRMLDVAETIRKLQ